MNLPINRRDHRKKCGRERPKHQINRASAKKIISTGWNVFIFTLFEFIDTQDIWEIVISRHGPQISTFTLIYIRNSFVCGRILSGKYQKVIFIRLGWHLGTSNSVPGTFGCRLEAVCCVVHWIHVRLVGCIFIALSIDPQLVISFFYYKVDFFYYIVWHTMYV